MTSSIPAIVPPLPHDSSFRRGLPAGAAVQWLAAGWRDLTAQPGTSLVYGLGVFAVSAAIVAGLFAFGLDYILFPAFAGFMVVGPLLAVGLYEKSRRIAVGETASLGGMIFVRAASGGQLWFTGVLLCLLMLLWMRAAVIVYALFFGLLPFPGLHQVAAILFTTPTGWALLIVGSVVGALFAASPSPSASSQTPMLLDEPTRCPDRDGHQHGAGLEQPAWSCWRGAIVLVLFVLSLASGPLGLIVVFPAGTWNLACLPRHSLLESPPATSLSWRAVCCARPAARTSSACPASIAAPASPGSSASWATCRASSGRASTSDRRVTVAWRGEAPPPFVAR
jgi:uncharacterized membrane protein